MTKEFFMPRKRNVELFILDVFISIYKIKTYTNSFSNGHDLQSNSLHWDATIRSFRIIDEAMNHILENEEFKALAPSYFRKIVNYKNIIVHGCFGNDSDEVWNIITSKLDNLNCDLYKIVTKHYDLNEAIQLTSEEYAQLNNKNVVEYLQTVSAVLATSKYQ